MVDVPANITAAWLKSLSDEERAEFLRSGWPTKMHQWAQSHVAYVMWNRRTLIGTLDTKSASIFFLDFGENVYAVTAAHVYDGYLDAKAKSGKHIVSQIGDLKFELADRFLSRGPSKRIDIATFQITREEIRKIGKQAVLASPWPPRAPVAGQAVYVVGYPGSSRFWIDDRSLSFGAFSLVTPVTRIDEERIFFEFNRELWVGEAPVPEVAQEIGGMSGCPNLFPLEQDGSWYLHLAGVVSEGLNTAIYATRAHFIHPDGTVRDVPVLPSTGHSLPTASELD